MLKKSLVLILLFLFLFLLLPVYAEYQPLSDEPIESLEDFEQTYEETEQQEYEYPSLPVQNTGDVQPSKDYAQIYNSLEPADFSYLHNIDPDQYYDMKDSAWSPYPLLRLNSPIYFKNSTIEPGYYLLTPREYQGKWYLLFKQNGIVMHIIPVYDRDLTPETFYDKNIARPKLTPTQKVHMGGLSFLGHIKSTKREEQPQTYMEINDLENYFVSIVLYFGSHRYLTIFRTIRL